MGKKFYLLCLIISVIFLLSTNAYSLTISPGIEYSVGNETYDVQSTMTFNELIIADTYIIFNDTGFYVDSPNDIDITLIFLSSDVNSAEEGEKVLEFDADTTAGEVTFQISGFTNGVTYNVKREDSSISTPTADPTGNITFSNDEWSSKNFDIYVESSDVPAAPNSFTASANGRFQIDLSWNDDEKADSTYVEKSLTDDNNWNRGEHTEIYNGTVETTSDSGLNPGTNYYYKAWSFNETSNVWSTGTTTTDTTDSNNAPSLDQENPSDNINDVSDSTSQLSINMSDTDGDNVDWTIQTNPNIGVNSGNNEATGVKTCTITGLTYSTTYTWYVNTTDGYSWTNETYTFTVESDPTINDLPVISSPNPSDGQGSVSKSLSSISVSISDPEGDSFNWSISTSPDIGSASNTFDDNGSKSVSISGLSYSTEYTWFVSVQEICSGNWSNMSFSFMTEAAPSNDPGPDPDPDDDDDDSGIDDDTSINNPPDRPILNALKQFLKQKIKFFFNVSSDDSDGDMVRFQFDWGNGSFSSWTDFVSSNTYLLIEHVFDKIGSYKVRVRAQDENGNYSDWSEPYNITISSFPEKDTNPPQAKINVSGNFLVNSSVVFDASESSSLSGNITSYFWDFGDGNTSDKKMAYHVFAESGVYNVTLVVTDNTGNSSWVYQDVTILEDSSDDSIGVNESDNNVKKEDNDSGLFWFLMLIVFVVVAAVCVMFVLRRFNIF